MSYVYYVRVRTCMYRYVSIRVHVCMLYPYIHPKRMTLVAGVSLSGSIPWSLGFPPFK